MSARGLPVASPGSCRADSVREHRQRARPARVRDRRVDPIVREVRGESSASVSGTDDGGFTARVSRQLDEVLRNQRPTHADQRAALVDPADFDRREARDRRRASPSRPRRPRRCSTRNMTRRPRPAAGSRPSSFAGDWSSVLTTFAPGKAAATTSVDALPCSASGDTPWVFIASTTVLPDQSERACPMLGCARNGTARMTTSASGASCRVFGSTGSPSSFAQRCDGSGATRVRDADGVAATGELPGQGGAEVARADDGIGHGRNPWLDDEEPERVDYSVSAAMKSRARLTAASLASGPAAMPSARTTVTSPMPRKASTPIR